MNPSAPDEGVPAWEGLPHEHPLMRHLAQLEQDLMHAATTHGGLHWANVSAIVIAEYVTAFTNRDLPTNVRNYAIDVAVMKAQTRMVRREQETREQIEVAAQVAAAEYAAGHMPDDASQLIEE